MKGIYRFLADFGRQGYLTGVFAANEKEIQFLIGRRIYFGEVLGKHSEVQHLMEESDFQLLTTDQDFIAKAEEYRLLPTGTNPLEYLSEDQMIELEDNGEN